MTKIVYNGCYGGFSLSKAAINRYAEIKGITIYDGKYLCPVEEFNAIHAEASAKPFSPDRYAKSNALYFSDREIDRTDPALVQVVEELGTFADGAFAALLIANIEDGTRYRIDEYDGYETVMTVESYDWKVA